MDGEVWRSVIGYEGIYDVSDIGNVRRTATGRVLKPGLRGDGYLYVSLSASGKSKTFLVSHIVADAFLPPKCPTDTVVRHLNDIPADNRARNLARGTLSDNSQDAIRNGRFNPKSGEAHPRAKLTANKVRAIRRLYATGNLTQQEIASLLGVKQRTVSDVVRRKIWKHVL